MPYILIVALLLLSGCTFKQSTEFIKSPAPKLNKPPVVDIIEFGVGDDGSLSDIDALKIINGARMLRWSDDSCRATIDAYNKWADKQNTKDEKGLLW